MRAKVYFSKLGDSVSEKDVERFFRNYGRVVDIILRNGCGFVEFRYERDAAYAFDDLNGKGFCGEKRTSRREITTFSQAVPSWLYKCRPLVTVYRLTAQNLSSCVSWQDNMRQAGEVTHADAHKERKNEGAVEFATSGNMRNVLAKLENLDIHGGKIKLVEEKPKERRRRSAVEFATYGDMKNVLAKLENLDIHGGKIKLIEEKPKGRRSSSRSRSRSRSRRSWLRSARQSHSRRSRSRSARRSRSRFPRDSTHQSSHDSPHASPHDGAHRSTHKSESRSPRKSQESQSLASEESLASSKSERRIHKERSQPFAWGFNRVGQGVEVTEPQSNGCQSECSFGW